MSVFVRFPGGQEYCINLLSTLLKGLLSVEVVGRENRLPGVF